MSSCTPLTNPICVLPTFGPVPCPPPPRPLLVDAGECNTAEELLALAADRMGWAEGVRQIDPVDHNAAAEMVPSPLDAHAEGWVVGQCTWWVVYRMNNNLIGNSKSRSATLFN